MLKKLNGLSFAAKILIVYICSLSFAILSITINQIQTAAIILEEESTQNLQMLTEQVALNFSEQQDSTSRSLYSRMVAFEIPSAMEQYNKEGGSRLMNLQYCMYQMVSDSSEFNYVVLELADGSRIATSRYETETYQEIRRNCEEILDAHPEISHGNCSWYRGSDGGVYVLRDIYNTDPLSWVGKAVVHMKGSVFNVSKAHENTGFLFFDKEDHYLSTAGMEVPDSVLQEIILEVKSDKLDNTGGWSKRDYYLSASTKGAWTTVGVSSTTAYRQMVGRIVQNGVIFGFVGLCFGIAILAVLIRILTQKLAQLRKAMTRVAEGDFTQQVPVSGMDDISQLADTMNNMTTRIRELLDELVEKERLEKNAQLQMLDYKYRSLETQIRPHFIYNALETVNAMAKIKGNTEIVEVVQRISRYFRGMTASTTRQFITCQQEFDMLQDYTEVYRYIHGQNLETTFSAKEAARNALIPTMILQPMVENALQHGVRNQTEPSAITVHAYVQEEKLVLTVKDTGHGLTPRMEQMLQSGQPASTNQGGVGVYNVRQRLQLIYGSDATFTIGNRPEGGVMVKIVIPLTYFEPDIPGEDDLDWDLD